MKWIGLVLGVMLAYSAFGRQRLEKVIVYPSQAQLWYSLDTQLTPGYHRLIFTDLPHSIVSSSIRWRASGSIQLLEWKVNEVPTDPDDVPSFIRPIYDSMQQYDLLVDSFERMVKHYATLQQLLQANMDVKGREALLPEDVEDIYQYVDRKNQYLLARLAKFRKKASRANQFFKYWKNRWDKASKPYQRETEVVLNIRVTSARERKFRVILDFLTKNASWHPEYRITAYPKKGVMTWMLMGNIHQQTGKDWHPDTLVLTNATPQQYLYVPRLSPWYLVVRDLQQKNIAMRTFAAPEVAADPSDASSPRKVQETQEVLLHEFSVVRPPKVPSTGEAIPVMLRLFSPKVSFEYRIYPSRSSSAILTGLVDNVDQYHFIKAPAKVFIKGRYNGRTQINPFSPDNQLVVSMGSDDNVVIEKKMIRKQRRGPGISGQYTVEYRYQYMLRNHYGWDVKALAIDQVPISPDRRVKVSYRTDGGIVDDGGLIKWPMVVPARDAKQWTLEIDISYPKELQILNLP